MILVHRENGYYDVNVYWLSDFDFFVTKVGPFPLPPISDHLCTLPNFLAVSYFCFFMVHEHNHLPPLHIHTYNVKKNIAGFLYSTLLHLA